MRHHTQVTRYTTQTPAPQRTVRQAVTDLRMALHDLLDPVERKVLRDGGATTTHRSPSLLDQLRDAGGHSGERGRSAGGGTRLPIDAAAVDLLVAITTSAADAHARALQHSQPTIEDHLRAAAALAERWQDPDTIDWLTTCLRRWQRGITDHLHPARRWHLAEACPVCHVHMAITRNDDGETVLLPALTVDYTTGADCRGCQAHWAPEQLEQLGADIRAHRQHA